MRKLIVGGTFDENGGKSSYIVSELSKTMGWETVNGGSVEIIRTFDPTGIDVLMWMPNVSNDELKIPMRTVKNTSIKNLKMISDEFLCGVSGSKKMKKNWLKHVNKQKLRLKNVSKNTLLKCVFMNMK